MSFASLTIAAASKAQSPKKAKPALKEIAKKVKEVITSKDSAEKKEEE